MKCKITGKKIYPFMSFGKMPIANGFLNKDKFDEEFFFEMEVGEIRQVNLQSLMSDKENVWKEICDKHNLNYYKVNELATWRFMDYAFNNGFDQMSCLNKIRKAGWNGLLDTEETITLQLKNMRNQKIIP